MSHTPSPRPQQPRSSLMRRQRTNRIRKSFRPQLADLEARHLLSHSGLSPHSGAHPTALAMSQPSAVSSRGPDFLTRNNDTSRTGAQLKKTTPTPKHANASPSSLIHVRIL